MTEIKPCPFCGNRAVNAFSEETYCEYSNQYEVFWSVQCPFYNGGCGATVSGSTRKEAIEAWNRRTKEEQK